MRPTPHLYLVRGSSVYYKVDTEEDYTLSGEGSVAQLAWIGTDTYYVLAMYT